MNTTAAPTATGYAPTAPVLPPAPLVATPSGRLRSLVARHGRLLAYAVIGLSAVVVDVGLFALLASVAGVHVLLANAISTGAALVYSFALNSFGNFKVTDRLLLRFASFAAVAGVGFAVSSVMIGISVGVFGIDPLIAKAITLPVVLALQYTLNASVTFRTRLGRTAS
jgi:putative flippase GtrA